MSNGEKSKFGFHDGTVIDVDGETIGSDHRGSSRGGKGHDDYGDDATRTLEPLDDDDDGANEQTVVLDVVESEMPRAAFFVLEGPDAGSEFPIRKDSVVVGRSLECDIVLNDPSVSRRHFRLDTRGNAFAVVDLGSGNGTMVDGEVSSERVLYDPATVSAGKTTLQLVIDGRRPAGHGAPGIEEVDAPQPGRHTPVDVPAITEGPEEVEDYEEESGGGFRWGLAGLLLVLLAGGAWAVGEVWLGWFDFFGMSPQARQTREIAATAEGAAAQAQNALAAAQAAGVAAQAAGVAAQAVGAEAAAKAQEDAAKAIAAAQAAAAQAAGAAGAAADAAGAAAGAAGAAAGAAGAAAGAAGAAAGAAGAAGTVAVPSADLEAAAKAHGLSVECETWVQAGCKDRGEDVCARMRGEAHPLKPDECAARTRVLAAALAAVAPGTPPPAADDIISSVARKRFDEGRQYIGNKQWKSAFDAFQEVRNLRVAWNREEVENAYSKAKLEVEAAQKLEEAAKQEESGRFAEAQELLKQIDLSSHSGIDAQNASPRVRAKHIAAIRESTIQQVKAKKFEDAEKEVDAGLLIYPEDSVLSELKDHLGKAPDDAYRSITGEDPPVEPGGTARAGTEVAPGGKTPPPAGEVKPLRFDAIYEAYKRGDLDGARSAVRTLQNQPASMSDKSKLQELAQAVDAFGKSYEPGKAAAAQKQSSAAGLLEKAYKADRTLGGNYRREISGLLADIYQKRAAEAYASSSFGTAVELAAKALSYVKGHENAQAVYDKSIAKGREFYQQALGAKEQGHSALARSLFRQVVLILPSSTPEHKQAKKLMAELE